MTEESGYIEEENDDDIEDHDVEISEYNEMNDSGNYSFSITSILFSG